MVITMKFFFFFFAVQRCTTTSVPESSSVSQQGGEGRGADGCPGQVRHRRYRREAVLVPAKDGVDDHHYKSVFFLMCDWINRLDPLLAPQRLSSARNQHVEMTSHICCCVQGQVQVTCGLSLMVRWCTRVQECRQLLYHHHLQSCSKWNPPFLHFCLPVMKNLIKSRTTAGMWHLRDLKPLVRRLLPRSEHCGETVLSSADVLSLPSGHCPFTAKSEGCTPSDRRKSLYQKFYRMVQEERKPADCVVISITNTCLWVTLTHTNAVASRAHLEHDLNASQLIRADSSLSSSSHHKSKILSRHQT